MNREKLIRMALEAGGSSEDASDLLTIGALERFAELIVRECADVAFKNVCYGNGEVGPETDILDHFGIER